MNTLAFYQDYWWFLISLLGALLVFLMFVQGGQGLMALLAKTDEERNLIAASLGRKWELTFTTLVTFGGAFFASFPLFYSTSFGGAFYVWMAILLLFVLQAVAYEYRRKPSNVLGQTTFDLFLVINGCLAPLLVGVAVGTFFTGAEFTVDRLNLASTAQDGATVISQWASPALGLEAVLDIRNLFLGFAISSLAALLGAEYLINNIQNDAIRQRAVRYIKIESVMFLLLFLAWLGMTLLSDGFAVDESGRIFMEPYKYFHNLVDMPLVALLFVVGVVLVLWSIVCGWQGKRSSIWFGGLGTVLTVLALLLVVGWNQTAYYPSLTDLQSSLTIRNSSSSFFTLKTMSIVSLLVPFVVAYIAYVWRAMNRKPISNEDLEEGQEQY